MNNVVSLFKGRVGLAENALKDVSEVVRTEIAAVVQEEVRPLRDLVASLILQIQEMGEDIRKREGELVKAIETTTPANVVEYIEADERVRQLKVAYERIKASLERSYYENIADGMPLIDKHAQGKVPKLTNRGFKLYKTWTDTITNLAETRGVTREHYTCNIYRPFFSELRVTRLAKQFVSTQSGRSISTVFASIIVNGYATNFTDYLFRLVDSEAEKHCALEGRRKQ